MKFLKLSKKDKSGNLCVRFSYIEGIDNVFPIDGEAIDVTIDRSRGEMTFVSALSKKRSAILALDKIIDVRDVTDTEIEEVNKSVVGRAVIGNLLMGPLGAIIGGMSAVGGTKAVKSKHHFAVITYVSNEKKSQIVLEIVGASGGWRDFIADLPKDENSPFIESKADGPKEL